MFLNNLKLPIKLIHPNLETIEIIDNINYLQFQTNLAVKESSLLNCIIEDNDKNYYRIIEVLDKGVKGPWWKFEFFNPMKRIELKFKLIDDEFTINKIKKNIFHL